MTFSLHLFNTFPLLQHSPSPHCNYNSSHSSCTAKFCPSSRVTASPSASPSLRKGDKLAGKYQRTTDWQLTCGSTETSEVASPENKAMQIWILALKRQPSHQGPSRASEWGKRNRSITGASKVCTCQHLNWATSGTRTIKQTTEVKLLFTVSLKWNCCFQA